MASRRGLLLALILAASATFIVGVSLERSSETGHHETSAASTPHQERAESDEHAESAHSDESTGHAFAADADRELRPLGIDIEAWPFVIGAVLASLALALAAWLRPVGLGLLALVAVVMLAFAALDAREIAHQIDDDNNGLATLAAVIAVLHLAAAAVAASMAARPDRLARPSQWIG